MKVQQDQARIAVIKGVALMIAEFAVAERRRRRRRKA
jgi:hypothetical protein